MSKYVERNKSADDPEGYEYVYYCRDCGDDWIVLHEEKCCTQCLSPNIREVEKTKL
jgi:hypothetical protein